MEYKVCVKAEPTIWYVDDDNVTGPWDGTKEHPYQNITSGLEHTSDGDTIFVYEGIYYECVVVNKGVSLVGEDRDSTIIDGNENGTVVSITANNVGIKGFTIRRSGTRSWDSGIFVHSSGNDISHNKITNNNDGIILHSRSNNLISDNTITNNNYGVSFYYSSNNMVSRNTITNNNYGVSFYYSSNNMVSRNTITNNNYGMYLAFDSSDNTICCNNFNNTHQMWSHSTNVWDNGKEGNYWSDYPGQDLNGDGIGDSPYVIDVNKQDDYPLMGMLSDFNITLERETCYVTTICNSTISEFRFEVGPETGSKVIRFNVTGKDGTVGFCRVAIPTELMSYPYIVLVGVEELVPTLLDVPNETYSYLYFTYMHSSQIITIISSHTRKLEIDLYNLNATYHAFLINYSILLGNYSQLQESYHELNKSYQEHLSDYSRSIYNIRNLMYIFAATTAIFIITTIYLSKHAHAGKLRFLRHPKKSTRSNVHTTMKHIYYIL